MRVSDVPKKSRYEVVFMSTVIISLAIAAILFLAGRKLYKDKKKGKSLCGGKCSCCPNGYVCNERNKNSI